MYTFSLKWRYFLGIFTVVTVLAGLGSFSLYQTQKQDYLDDIDARLILGAQMGRNALGADFHDTLTNENVFTPAAYPAIVEHAQLQRLWSYLLLTDGRVVLTSSSSPGHSHFQIDPDLDHSVLAQKSGKATFANFVDESGSGRMLLLPFQDKLGRSYIFGASIGSNQIEQRLMVKQWQAWAVFFSLLMMAALTYWIFSRLLLRQPAKVDEANLLKALIKTMPDLIWLKDSQGVYLACNPEFEKLYGAKEAEIVGKTDFDFVDQSLAEFFRKNDLAAIQNNRPTINEEWLVYADHSHEGLMETTKTPMYSDQGEVIGVLGVAHDITVYREQEKALRRESEKNLAILHNASDGIHILDFDGNLVEASDSFCAMLGYSRDDALRLNFTDWDAQFTKTKLMEILRDQFDNPKRILFETRHKRWNGDVFDVEVSCYPLKIDGDPVLFCSSRDISARKQIEAALQRSESRLQRAQEVAHIGSWILDIPSGQLEWSLEVYRIFGLDVKESITLERFFACLHPDEIENIQAAWNAALSGADYDIEHRILANGEVRWVREIAKIDFGKGGTPLTGIGTVQDITDSHHLTETLHLNQQRLSFALQGASDGLWDWNLDTNEVYYSPRWLDMLGYQPDELPMHFDTWSMLAHPDDRESTLIYVTDYLEGRISRYECEFRMRHKQGHWIYILSRAKLATDDTGKFLSPRRLVGTHVDVTARKQAEQALAHQVAFTEMLINAQSDGISACRSVDVEPYIEFSVWNKTMQELTGYTMAEVNQRGWYQTVYIDPDVQERARLRMERMRQGEHLQGEEWTITRKNGEQRTVQISTAFVIAADGMTYVLAVMHDVTEQLRAQMQLRESEERLRVLYEKSADPILLIENNCFIDCNQAAINLLGLTSAEQIQRIRPVDISPEYQSDGRRSDEKSAEMIQRAMTQGSHLFAWEHQSLDGQLIKVEVMLTLVIHNDKPLLHALWRDLSRLHAAQLELQRRERYQRAVLDNFPFIVWLKDAESRFLAVNQPFAKACGLANPEELIGKTDYDIWPQELAERYRVDDIEVLTANRSKTVEELISGPSEESWFETYKSPITLDGQVIGTVGFARDISERKLAEKTKQRYGAIQDLLYQISSSFINLPQDQVDIGINQALGDLAIFVGFDRACVFSYDVKADTVSKTHEWCGSGVNPQIDVFQNISLIELSGLMSSCGNSQVTIIPDVSGMMSCTMRDTLERLDVKSLVMIPLVSKQNSLGWVGFSTVSQPFEFEPEDIKLLSLFATLLLNLNERRTVEEVLRKNQQLLSETQQVGRIGGWRAAPGSNQLEWSEGVYKLVEMPLDYHPDLDAGLDFYPGESRARVVEMLKRSLETGQGFSIETELRSADGKDLMVELRGAPHFINDRLEYLTGTLQDITPRKQAEQALEEYRLHLEDMVHARTAELEAVNRRLSMSDQRLSAMLAMSQRVNELSEDELLQLGIEEAVRLTDSDIGYLHFVNEDQETIALYTWSANTLNYCTAAHDTHYPVSMAGIWADTVRFKKPVVHNDYQRMQHRQGYPEGHAHLIRHLGVPVIEDNRVVLLMGVGNKTTDYDDSDINQLQLIGNDLWAIVVRRRITQALAVAREAAEAASRAKSTFLANMSHELRTPMNGILGMTSLALRRADDPKLRDQLNKIEQASQHLLSVINDILDISQIEAERMNLEQIDFKLNQVLDNVVNLNRARAMEKGLALNVDISPEIEQLSLMGDPLRLGQILLNLAGNAVKFTENGCVNVIVRVVEDYPGEVLLRFEVQDTGIGIAADDIKRLFTAFEQADSSMTRKYGGTGLGLVISKRLVQMMGGEIGLTSQLGLGTCFWFTVRLPKMLKEVEQKGEIALETAETRLIAEFSGTHVLLVEDEPINQEVSRWLLQEVGLVVDLAEDGAEAIELARKNTYALILMDMQLPIMNGIDATRIIRMLPGYSETPILAMTANAFAEDRQACMDAGMNDHIGKPVNPDALYETLLNWLSPLNS